MIQVSREGVFYPFSVLLVLVRTWAATRSTHPFTVITTVLALTMPRPHLHICRRAPPPRGSALQQPSDILIHDKRDAGSRKHPDDIRGQAAIKPSYAFVRPGVRDRGWDGTVVGAREHRVVLLTFVSCFFFSFFFRALRVLYVCK
jgi:hypothetical protein